jgi:hypothetical protein
MARAGKVGNVFFILWGILSLTMVGAGLWLQRAGLRFREDHEEAEAVVVGSPVGKPGQGRQPRMELRWRYAVAGTSYEIPAPERLGKHRLSPGYRAPIWYEKANPQAASTEGEQGRLIAGYALTVGGVVFLVLGALAAFAEFYPNRFIRFDQR